MIRASVWAWIMRWPALSSVRVVVHDWILCLGDRHMGHRHAGREEGGRGKEGGVGPRMMDM